MNVISCYFTCLAHRGFLVQRLFTNFEISFSVVFAKILHGYKITARRERQIWKELPKGAFWFSEETEYQRCYCAAAET